MHRPVNNFSGFQMYAFVYVCSIHGSYTVALCQHTGILQFFTVVCWTLMSQGFCSNHHHHRHRQYNN